MKKNRIFKAISGKIFHPLNAVNKGGTQNGSAYRKGLYHIGYTGFQTFKLLFHSEK